MFSEFWIKYPIHSPVKQHISVLQEARSDSPNVERLTSNLPVEAQVLSAREKWSLSDSALMEFTFQYFTPKILQRYYSLRI